ncbi:MAG: hypothetical protein RBR39_07945 [Proteiniphilum sp.]|jgi:ERCC4-type nuclease|nr:hypothetical protein [Proteiniphilum sp.]
MISIIMAPGERGTDRHLALAEYIADKPDEYDFSFGDVEVDLVFSLVDHSLIVGETEDEYRPWRKDRAVELKIPADFAGSLQNGHLSSQRRQCPYPLQVAVLGSPGDVYRALRDPAEAGMIRRGIAALKASGVDVAFGVSPLDMPRMTMEVPEEWAMRENISQIVRESRACLEGDIHLPMPKCESTQEAMLMCLPGVGPTLARNMIDAGIEPALWCEHPPGTVPDEYLMEKLLAVPKIGKVKAAKILAAIQK